jgi:uncharacterized protein with von Willebrand factor type A (vWA) domain
VVLADVSGSMDLYSRFLVQFLYGLQQELRGVSTFVFSTRLFEVTPMLRARSFEAALRLVAQSVDGWSGGTQIGASLADFNLRYGRERVGRDTVLIVLSDGWDRGDAESVGREMAVLQRRARRVIWLNPLLGSPGYRLARERDGGCAAVLRRVPAGAQRRLAGGARSAAARSRRALSAADEPLASAQSASGGRSYSGCEEKATRGRGMRERGVRARSGAFRGRGDTMRRVA